MSQYSDLPVTLLHLPQLHRVDAPCIRAFVTSVRQYDEAVIFEQTFPKGVVGTSLSAANPMSVRNDVSTAFPTLIPANVRTRRRARTHAHAHARAHAQHQIRCFWHYSSLWPRSL